ncbi:CoA ester lyase [Streptomyces sp. NPDC005820]|uniref:HpcH/HpaI aldolase/citrate lyase family protein n=1 Tax=Streptomyces sp. NPDC005820 TaxID=3157069 RepID=UPI0033E71CA1
MTSGTSTTEPAPRSCLVVPATDERKMAKALSSIADEVVLDLEDSVEPDSKARARERAAEVIARNGPRRGLPRLAVRVNQVGTAWCHLDLLAAVGAARGPLTVVVPKVESASHLGFVSHLVSGALAAEDTSPRPDIRLDALVESAAGLRNLDEVLALGDPLRAVVIGYADLGADLGCDLGTTSAGAEAVRAAVRSRVLTAARAAGRLLLDGPWLSVTADDDFVTNRRQAREQGFDGSWAIHPAQLQVINDLFTPSTDELLWARRVLDSLAAAASSGAGAVALDGQMLDEAIAVRARRVLALAEARR